MRNDPYRFNVVCFKDLPHLNGHHRGVRNFVSDEQLTSLKEFPGANDDFPVFFYLANDDEICCYFRTIPDELTVDGDTRPWAWTGDNYTQTALRGQGLSTRLQRLGTEYLHERGIGRGSVYSTEVTLSIFEKIGFVLPGYARRYLLLRSGSPFVRANIANRSMSTAAECLANPLVWLGASGARLLNEIAPRYTTCKRLACLSDPQLKDLLRRIAAGRQVHFRAQIDCLERKFAIAEKTGEMSAWLIHEASTGSCLGYMIIRERFQHKPLANKYHGFRLMTLMDYAVSDLNARSAKAVVRHAIDIFFSSRCQVLEILSNEANLQRAARRSGLMRIGKGMSFSYSLPQSWKWNGKSTRLDDWPLTSFCGDGFTF